MTAIIVTAHAASRYQQRIAPHLSLDQCREAIRSHSAAIVKAHAFRCPAVLTAAGAKLFVTDEFGTPTVTTVGYAHQESRTSIPRNLVKRFGKLRRQGRGE